MTYSEDSYEKIELIHLTQCVFFFSTEVKNPDLHSFCNFPNTTDRVSSREKGLSQVCRLQACVLSTLCWTYFNNSLHIFMI